MISTPDRQNTIALIEQAKAAGARRAQACAEVGIDERTCRRWRAMDGTPEDRRPTAPRPVPRNQLSEQERQAVLDICNSKPFEVVPRLADQAGLFSALFLAVWGGRVRTATGGGSLSGDG